MQFLIMSYPLRLLVDHNIILRFTKLDRYKMIGLLLIFKIEMHTNRILVTPGGFNFHPALKLF